MTELYLIPRLLPHHLKATRMRLLSMGCSSRAVVRQPGPGRWEEGKGKRLWVKIWDMKEKCLKIVRNYFLTLWFKASKVHGSQRKIIQIVHTLFFFQRSLLNCLTHWPPYHHKQVIHGSRLNFGHFWIEPCLYYLCHFENVAVNLQRSQGSR